MKNPLSRCTPFFLATALLALAACGGGGGGGGSTPQPGTLGVSLTDAPACGYDQVNVTVAKVRVHQSSSADESAAGWQEITLNPARKINLLGLQNGVLENLGQVPLPAGHYTQIRLVLVANGSGAPANSVVPTGGSETPLDTPSAVQTGIKLINQFDVPAGGRVDLVLDFDACKSVVARGNGSYGLKPVVRVVPTQLNGINGFVDPALLAANVRITAQQGGVVLGATTPNSAGEFFVARLAAGSYDLVITADDHATALISGVPIAGPSVVMVSTNAAPITLPDSATETASGKVTPVAAEALLRASQSLTGGPTVEVAFTTADPSTGQYALTLPVAAPLSGSYGAGTLPIGLTAQPTAAGKYTLEASATGYATQTAGIDLTAGDVVKDFALTP